MENSNKSAKDFFASQLSSVSYLEGETNCSLEKNLIVKTERDTSSVSTDIINVFFFY